MERFFLILLTILFFNTSLQAREPLPPDEASSIIQEFHYQGVYQEISKKETGGLFSRCDVFEIDFETDYPGNTETLIINAVIYRPKKSSLKDGEQIPTVMMLPPIGGVNPLDERTAKNLCAYKMAAVIITNDFANIDAQANGPLLPVTDHNQTFYRVSAAIKGLISMARTDDGLDDDKFGLFGVSLGGILGSFVMTSQPEISAGYFVVAGGDIPKILAISEQDEILAIRKKRMKEQNFKTTEEYEAYLRQALPLDPIDLASTIQPETVNMVISKNDTTVPSPNQFDLHLAFGEPEAHYTNSSHLDTILGFLFPGGNQRKIATFFEERFALPNPRPTHFPWPREYGELAAF